jgi:hypothetical protein
LDEVFVTVNGKLCYLWPAVDHEGEILEAVPVAIRAASPDQLLWGELHQFPRGRRRDDVQFERLEARGVLGLVAALSKQR